MAARKRNSSSLPAVWAQALQSLWGREEEERGGERRGKCVTLLVRASISVMDELSSKKETKKKKERQKDRETVK